MTALKIFTGGRSYDITGKGYSPEGHVFLDNKKLTGVKAAAAAGVDPYVSTTLLTAILCSNTTITKAPNSKADAKPEWQSVGNASEAPVVVAAMKWGYDPTTELENYPRIDEVPFSSSRKLMLTIHKLPEPAAPHAPRKFGSIELPPDTRYIACVKGAPNYVLKTCSSVLVASDWELRSGAAAAGEAQVLNGKPIARRTDAVISNSIQEMVDDYSEMALRCLAVAYKPFTHLPVRLVLCSLRVCGLCLCL